MKNTKILIVEDEILIAEYILELLHHELFENVIMAHSAADATRAMSDYDPDIILMDINLNGVNAGIELAKQKNYNASVIYLTGQYDNDLVSKAFKTNPASYLTKPIKKNDLIAAIKLIIYKQEPKFIIIKNGYTSVKINLDEILFIKSENNYIDIQLEHKKYSVRKTLDSLMIEIQSALFLRIHRSYVVNTSKITAKESNFVRINEFEIPFSRRTDFTL